MSRTDGAVDQEVINVVVAYEQGNTRVYVREALSQVYGPAADGIKESATQWKFSVLETSIMFRQAVDDAVHSDVIIVCASGECDLPQTVKQWIGQWVEQSGSKRRSLVGLLDAFRADEQAAEKIFKFLRTAAAAARMEWHGRYVEFEEAGFGGKARARWAPAD